MIRTSFLAASAVTSMTLIATTAAQGTTIFGAKYDSSKTAQVASGNPVPTTPGLTVIDNTNFKFGGGSLDPTLVTSGGNGMRYATAGNVNPNVGTIDLWFRAPGWNGFPRRELVSMFAGGYTGDISLYLLNDNFGGKLAVDVDVAGHNQWALRGTTTSVVLGDGNWHHVAYEWDSATNTTALFLDGVLETNTNVVGGGSVNFAGGTLAQFMEVGSRQSGFDPLAGNIDDLRISDVALYNGQNFTPPTQSTIVPEAASMTMMLAGGALLLRRWRM